MTTIPLSEVELTIGGMTCASCANRVERRLNRLDGVHASVNYATEKARVQVPDGLDPALLVAQAAADGGGVADAKIAEASAAIARLVKS